jgi:uncharacterized 2Fe-2S/4Fe-4S cluster protein (DUF4445 family)
MPDAHFLVVFQPAGRAVRVPEGTPVLEAAAGAGLPLEAPCGGEGTCGKCRVLVRDGAGPPCPADQRFFHPAEVDAGWRLACQSVVRSPMSVEIPADSLLGARHKILAEAQAAPMPAADPPVVKRFLQLPPPERGDDVSDLGRMERAIGPVDAALDVLRHLPRRLRDAEFCGTAVLADGRLLDFEPGDTRGECFVAAVDVGTTTLVAVLADPATGRQAAVASRLNPQTAFGDDVLSRILHAQESPRGLDELRDAVVRAVDEMLGELAAEAGVDRRRIYGVSFAGNTTMQQLLLGIDPRHLGEVPFVPVVSGPVLLPAAQLGVSIHPRARAYVLPVIGGFVGGDTVAGMLATDLADLPGPTLFVDIGTNGEIVLAADGKLSAASTAAGPAFEGARIAHGMRASAGAIEKVVVADGRLQITTIGGERPIGLCGSALIDVAAELLRHRVLAPDGRLRTAGELPEGVSEDLRARLVEHEGKTVFGLVGAEASGHGRPVFLTQRDFRELQLASGAIRAGITILLRRAGLRPEDLDSVLLGGAFGNYIRRTNARRIGLLPGHVPPERIRFHGNTSLAGARLVILSRQARAIAEELARRTEHVDLSGDPDFRWAFAEAMVFPSE